MNKPMNKPMRNSRRAFRSLQPLPLSLWFTSALLANPTEDPTPRASWLPQTVVFGKPYSLTIPSIEVMGRELDRVPGATTLIDAETYKKGRANTLKDALDYAPGVFVQPRFGSEEARISIRGSGLQRTFHGRGLKLMQDEVPLNIADGGFDFQAVDPLTARSIEVYRGANALQFGATTLGGAINFTTPTGYDAPGVRLRTEYGSFNTARALYETGRVVGPFDYYTSFSHLSTEGYRDHSAQNNQRLFSNFGLKLNDSLETRFFVTWVHSQSELPGSLTKAQLETNPRLAARSGIATFDNITSDWQRNYDLLRIANKTTWQQGDHRLTLTSFYSRKDLHHPILFVIDQLTDDFGMGLRYDYSGDVAGHRNRFTLGFNPTWGFNNDRRYDNVRGASGTQRAHMRQYAGNFDLYADNQFWITEQLALSLGGQISAAQRSNENRALGNNPAFSDDQQWWGYSPKIGLLFESNPGLQWFANLSRSFEPPSFGELVGTSLSGFPNFSLTRTLPVPLEAQTATTVEVGTRGKRNRFQWELAWYHAWIENELLEFQIAPGLNRTVNAGKTIHHGIEAGGSVDVLRGLFDKGQASAQKQSQASTSDHFTGDKLVLRGAYLWNQFRYQNDPTYGDRPLAGIPEHYVRSELTYEHPAGFYVGPNLECVPKGYRVDSAGTLFTDSYFLLGARIGWRSAKKLSVFLEGRNLTDKRYAATTGVVSNATTSPAQFLPGDGRSLFLGVEYRW
jgi:iron complex outermembrane receptor protein